MIRWILIVVMCLCRKYEVFKLTLSNIVKAGYLVMWLEPRFIDGIFYPHASTEYCHFLYKS